MEMVGKNQQAENKRKRSKTDGERRAAVTPSVDNRHEGDGSVIIDGHFSFCFEQRHKAFYFKLINQ